MFQRDLLHALETLFGRLLSLLRVVGVVDGGLEASSDVVGVLIGIVFASGIEVTILKNL